MEPRILQYVHLAMSRLDIRGRTDHKPWNRVTAFQFICCEPFAVSIMNFMQSIGCLSGSFIFRATQYVHGIN